MPCDRRDARVDVGSGEVFETAGHRGFTDPRKVQREQNSRLRGQYGRSKVIVNVVRSGIALRHHCRRASREHGRIRIRSEDRARFRGVGMQVDQTGKQDAVRIAEVRRLDRHSGG